MPSVTVKEIHASVPAKVILFGEHFVVYGTRALAAAINCRLTVGVSGREKSGYHVKIENIPTFGLELDLEEQRGGKALTYKDFSSATRAIAYVKAAIEYLQEQYGLGREGAEIEITSEIPLSAGLGSSAATCVATIAALRAYFGIEGDMNKIQKDAHAVEKLVQGAASPIDTAISTYGGYVLVERNEVKRLRLPELDLMVGCIGSIPLSMDSTKATELSLKTKTLVAGVRERKELFSGIFDPLFDAVDELTAQAIRAIEEGDSARLGALMNINHGLLDAIGVVPRRLSELVKVSQELGALGAKVTGAGGTDDMGGIGSVLVLPGESGARIKAAMEIAGALAMDVKTGGEGLKIEPGY
ncbi:MAG: mevalonate kinase [Methanophagales archaeon ANME-1-THS]|nr:MAG: mevalonate kinase [Methanophagales archaeon ANME-1-THS]